MKGDMAKQFSGGREAIFEDQTEWRKVSCLLKVGRHMAESCLISASPVLPSISQERGF